MAVEAETEAAEGEVAAAPAKKGIPRRLIVIAAAALIACGGGQPAPATPSEPGAAPAAEGEAQADAAAAAPDTFIFNLPTMTVNLNDDGATGDQFLKLTVALEVANEGGMKDIQPRIAKIIDAFQVYLRELRKSDLEGSAGIYRLKEELRRRINVAIFPAQIDGILFKELLVQ